MLKVREYLVEESFFCILGYYLVGRCWSSNRVSCTVAEGIEFSWICRTKAGDSKY